MAEEGEKSRKEEKKIVLGIPLTYDGSSGEGTLTELKVGALVDYGNPDVESSKFAMTHSHRSSLACYIATGGPEDRIAVYEEAPKTLRSCFEELGPSIEVYRIPAKDENGTPLPTEELHSSTYIPNCYRRIIADMIHYVEYLHSHGQSIHNGIFLDHNLRYKDGKVKYFGLNIGSSDERSRKKDFMYVSRVIESVIEQANTHGLDKPVDFNHLVSLMTNFNPANTVVITSHLAILSTDDRIAQIKRFSDIGSMDKVEKKEYYDALKYTTIVDRNWVSRFTNEKSHRLGPANDCFWHHAVKDDNGRLIPTYDNSKRALIRYCRNLVEHVDRHFPSYNLLCHRMDYELIAMALYGEELVSFQQEASQYNIYEKFFSQYT